MGINQSECSLCTCYFITNFDALKIVICCPYYRNLVPLRRNDLKFLWANFIQ